MIDVADILMWLVENGYMYNENNVLEPQISLEETQRMIDELGKKEEND